MSINLIKVIISQRTHMSHHQYTLNIHNFIHQLYLNEIRKNKKIKTKGTEIQMPLFLSLNSTSIKSHFQISSNYSDVSKHSECLCLSVWSQAVYDHSGQQHPICGSH